MDKIGYRNFFLQLYFGLSFPFQLILSDCQYFSYAIVVY